MELGPDDMASLSLGKRHHARKVVSEATGISGNRYVRNMAEFIQKMHKPGTLTLAILNTVERAREVYRTLNNPQQIKTGRGDSAGPLALPGIRSREETRNDCGGCRFVRSRYGCSGDPGRRSGSGHFGANADYRTVPPGHPWCSGSDAATARARMNRATSFGWDMGERSQDTVPYDPEDVAPARQSMKALEGKSAGPSDLEGLANGFENIEHLTVIRRRDVVGLFDTTPDLSGSYLDVSQYVRGTDERNVLVFWRDVPAEGPGEKGARSRSIPRPLPSPSERTSTTILRMTGAERGSGDFLDDRWRQVTAS